MKNLKKFNTEIMNNDELKEVNGGWAWLPYVSVSIIAYNAVKGFVKGFQHQLKIEAPKLNV